MSATMDELIYELDDLLAAKDREVSAQIDAYCCRTDRDWRKASEAEQEFLEKREAFVASIRKALREARGINAKTSGWAPAFPDAKEAK